MATSTKTAKAQSVKQIKAAIELAAKSAKAMRSDIQLAAVKILIHANKHGDYSFANELVAAVAEGTNINSLVNWFEIYGGLIVDAENAENGFTSWKGKDHISENFEAAKAKNWWTCKPQTPFKGFDLTAEIAKLVKKAQTQAAKARKLENEGDDEKLALMNVDPKVLEQLTALAQGAGIEVKPAEQVNEKNVKDVASTKPKKTTKEPKK